MELGHTQVFNKVMPVCLSGLWLRSLVGCHCLQVLRAAHNRSLEVMSEAEARLQDEVSAKAARDAKAQQVTLEGFGSFGEGLIAAGTVKAACTSLCVSACSWLLLCTSEYIVVMCNTSTWRCSCRP